MVTASMKAPFVWFGGKRRVAPLVWDALGDVDNFVEPFAGSSGPYPCAICAELRAPLDAWTEMMDRVYRWRNDA